MRAVIGLISWTALWLFPIAAAAAGEPSELEAVVDRCLADYGDILNSGNTSVDLAAFMAQNYLTEGAVFPDAQVLACGKTSDDRTILNFPTSLELECDSRRQMRCSEVSDGYLSLHPSQLDCF
jgi:hypothetical protein